MPNKKRKGEIVLRGGAVTSAKRSLRVWKTLPYSKKYGTTVGHAMAKKIASGKPVPARKVYSFLNRSYPNYFKAKSRGGDETTSKAIGAFNLWGGVAAMNQLSRFLYPEKRSR